MQRTRSNASEPKHLFYSDALVCLACGCEIWFPNPYKTTWKFKEIDRAYFAHVKKCFGLKKIIVIQRKGYLNNEKI